MDSESPLRKSFWFGTIDPRPLALFRIGFGFVLLFDALKRTTDFRAFLTDDGILPRGVLRDPSRYSAFDLFGSTTGVAALYAVGIAAIIAFLVGYRTRVATVVCWLFFVSLYNRNPYVSDGGDDVARALLLFCAFTDLGAWWSIDARRIGRPLTKVPSFPLRVLQLYVAIDYFIPGYLKLKGGWLGGTRVYESLQLLGMVRPPGVWLGSSPMLCGLVTYATLVIELGFPLLAFAPILTRPLRATAIALFASLQLGIILTMRVGIWTELMLWTCVPFLLPEWIEWAENAIRRRLKLPPAPQAMPVPAGRGASPGRRFAYLLLSIQFFVFAMSQINATSRRLPAIMRREMALISLHGGLSPFSVVGNIEQWHATGTLTDGRIVEMLPVAAPGLESKVQFGFSRWYKFTFKDGIHFPELALYLCRIYDERAQTAPLERFTLEKDVHPALLPGQAAPPDTHVVLWSGRCGE